VSKRLLVLFLAGFPLLAQTQEMTARRFVDLLAKRDYAKAQDYFDDSAKGLVPVSQLETAWNTVISQLGPLTKQLGVRTEKMGSVDLVYVDCQFENKSLSIKVLLNDQHKILAFSLVPHYPSLEAKIPDSVVEESFDVSDLPGTLTAPKQGGPFPAVVLVHGSGPSGRDETFGPNKPFRDLAWGLAARDIVVLRYDKRTNIHPEQFRGNFTVKEETLDDSLAAVIFAYSEPD